jgi:hypothetical protein
LFNPNYCFLKSYNILKLYIDLWAFDNKFSHKYSLFIGYHLNYNNNLLIFNSIPGFLFLLNYCQSQETKIYIL